MVRALIYVGMAREAVDERGFEAVRRIRQTHSDLPLSSFKALVREQFNMLLLDAEGAIAAIPAMLPPEADMRLKAFSLIKKALSARGAMSTEDTERLQRIQNLFNVDGKSIPRPLAIVTPAQNQAEAP
jgi:hypothetical protein